MQGAAILFRQVAIILGPHAAFFAVDARFLVFQAAGLAGGELATLHSIANALLLR